MIPEMTHPLSKHWEQPELKEIRLLFGNAYMDQAAFNKLHEYSSSQPSGVYEGKMWRSKLHNGKWLLRWYGFSEKPDCCSNNSREIILV